jgi:hypothetical protein
MFYLFKRLCRHVPNKKQRATRIAARLFSDGLAPDTALCAQIQGNSPLLPGLRKMAPA